MVKSVSSVSDVVSSSSSISNEIVDVLSCSSGIGISGTNLLVRQLELYNCAYDVALELLREGNVKVRIELLRLLLGSRSSTLLSIDRLVELLGNGISSSISGSGSGSILSIEDWKRSNGIAG